MREYEIVAGTAWLQIETAFYPGNAEILNETEDKRTVVKVTLR